VSSRAFISSRVDSIPRYDDFYTIRKNFLVGDTDGLRDVPYLGENS